MRDLLARTLCAADDRVVTSAEVEWLDSPDVVVAAPEHHTAMFDNDRVRVLDARVPPVAVVELKGSSAGV